MSERPAWSLMSRAFPIWTEDDATASSPDHERLEAAFQRIFRVPMPKPIETYDDGDAIYELLPALVVVRRSYPGNNAIAAWPILLRGFEVTIVLKWPNSVKLGEGRLGRLVHTFVSSWQGLATFSANDDDRPEHKVTDHTVTWLRGHVDFESKEALALLRAAEQADLNYTEG
jgi:hypothetical protein